MYDFVYTILHWLYTIYHYKLCKDTFPPKKNILSDVSTF